MFYFLLQYTLPNLPISFSQDLGLTLISFYNPEGECLPCDQEIRTNFHSLNQKEKFYGKSWRNPRRTGQEVCLSQILVQNDTRDDETTVLDHYTVKGKPLRKILYDESSRLFRLLGRGLPLTRTPSRTRPSVKVSTYGVDETGRSDTRDREVRYIRGVVERKQRGSFSTVNVTEKKKNLKEKLVTKL